MPIDSLLEMARRAAAKSFRNITDIGDCPYELIRPVLLRIESPDQLRQLEQHSPQVVGKTREIWLNLIKRDIPDWEDKVIYPNNPDNWWKVYRKLKKDLKRDNEAGEALLKARLSGIKNEREENFARLTTKKPTQAAPRKAKAVYNYASGRTGAGRGAAPTNIFDKMRRDAGARPSNRMAIPTHRLTGQSTRITKAPLAMVEEIRAQKRSSPPRREPANPRPVPLRSPKGPLHAPNPSKVSQRPYDMTSDREERLRRLKAGNTPRIDGNVSGSSAADGRTNGLSEDFLEDEDDLSEDTSPERQTTTPLRGPKSRQPLDGGNLSSRSTKRKEPPSLFHSPAKRVVK